MGLSYDLARRAHSGTSMVPETRARQEVDSYAQGERERFDQALAWFDGDTGKAMEVLTGFEARRLARYTRLLSARSRIVSTFIAGASNFPTRRMNKFNDSYDRALKEFCDWDERVWAKIQREHDPRIKKPISSGDPEAVTKYREKIAKLTAKRDLMKAANKIVKSAKLARAEKIAQLAALGIPGPERLLEPDFAGRLGFADYELSNTGAEIRRCEKQILTLTHRAAQAEREWTFDGGHAWESKADNRMCVKHDEKPPKDVIDKLNHGGWNWSGQNQRWQRFISEGAVWSLRHIVTNLVEVAGDPDDAPITEELAAVADLEALDLLAIVEE